MIMPFSVPHTKNGGFLGVFAKEPLAGRVKTRLCPPLSPEEAAEFQRLALHETLARLTLAAFRPTLCFSGGEGYFRRAFPGRPLLGQGEGNLGARMERVLDLCLGSGCGKAVIIGSDSPDLPLERVAEAFALLEETEAVVVPASDGGYVLIGESRHHGELFHDIPWGSAGVLAATRCRAREIGVSLAELEGWEDIDDGASLLRFVRRSPASPAAQYVRRQLALKDQRAGG